jgi:hypothetical protein
MRKNLIFISIAVAIIAGGAGFFGGIKYQQTKTPAFFRQNGAVMGQRAGAGNGNANRAGFRPVSGEIISADSNSITVKLSDGSSKIVLVNDQTVINKAETASKDDLKLNETVAVFGQDNSDGSVTAQNIQLNPQNRDFQNQTQNQ